MRQSLTPQQKSTRATLAVHASWANTSDPAARTAPGLKAANVDRFERQVDPNNELPAEERARRAEHARKAHMLKLALASSRARAARKGRTDTQRAARDRKIAEAVDSTEPGEAA